MTDQEQPIWRTSYAGVVWHSAVNKWHARITRNGKTESLGYFDTESDALNARQAAEVRLDGKVSNRMIRSAFDAFAETFHPTPWDKKPTGESRLPSLSGPPSPSCTVSADELFAFITATMTLRSTIIFWQRDGGIRPVQHEWGKDCESLLVFNIQGERQVVRHAEIAWMLTHKQPVPNGRTIKHSDGKLTNRDPHNLWLV